jgi:hypothetical protein
MHRLPATFLAMLLLFAVSGGARGEADYHPTSDEFHWTEVEEGIHYTTWSFAGKKARNPKAEASAWEVPPAFVHLLRIDLEGNGLTVRSIRPLGRSQKIEKMVEIFREGGVDVRAALNGDYFSFTQSEKDPLGLHVSGGQLLWFPANTTSLVVDAYNRVHMDRYTINQEITGKDFKVHVTGANRKAAKQESVLYSGYYLKKTLPQEHCSGVVLTRAAFGPMLNAEIEVTVGEAFGSRKAQRLEPLDFALVTCGDAREAVKTLTPGTKLTLSTRVPDFDGALYEAISGGPRVLRDGKVVKEIGQEGFTLPLRLYIPQKHPRAAVGIAKDGKAVYLLAAEGRIRRSAGLSGDDAATILAAAGAWDAMLFDGGGSVALMGPEGFYNVPHDKRNRTARSIANALAIVRTKKSAGKDATRVK